MCFDKSRAVESLDKHKGDVESKVGKGDNPAFDVFADSQTPESQYRRKNMGGFSYAGFFYEQRYFFFMLDSFLWYKPRADFV